MTELYDGIIIPYPLRNLEIFPPDGYPVSRKTNGTKEPAIFFNFFRWIFALFGDFL